MQRGAPDALLDEWSKDRVAKFRNVLDPLSRACFAAVRHPEADSIAQRHPFLKAFKAGPAGGPPPSLQTECNSLYSWVLEEGSEHESATEKENIQLIWSKA